MTYLVLWIFSPRLPELRLCFCVLPTLDAMTTKVTMASITTLTIKTTMGMITIMPSYVTSCHHDIVITMITVTNTTVMTIMVIMIIMTTVTNLTTMISYMSNHCVLLQK
jgi:hypothetical protein